MTDQQHAPATTVAGNPAEWNLPDTEICAAALQLVTAVSPAYLTNHCVRSYLFARELAAGRGLRSGTDYDDELVYLVCILHDLGITDYALGEQRFEVDGADAAAQFLRERAVSDDRVTTVWQGIALHTSLGLAERFGPVQSLAFAGISLDIDGMAKGSLPPGFADRLHAAWPRHDLGYTIAAAIAEGTRANPVKAPPFSFPAHLHALINGAPPLQFHDIVAASGWGDQPLD